MSNEILISLLKEYEQKKLRAEMDFEQDKYKLYTTIPRLQQIDDEINRSAFCAVRNTLNDNRSLLLDLKQKISTLKLEKLDILKLKNISEEDLSPKYECKLCNDTGYISDRNYKSTMCSCLKQRLLNVSFNNSNMSNLYKENFSTFNEEVFPHDVDISKYKLNISPRNNIVNIKNKCQEFVYNFDDPEYKNLLFTGSTGLR